MRLGAVRVLAAVVLSAVQTAAIAADCPGRPDALGTSRVLVVDPAAHTRLGTMQYRETLPLADKEVVLTFDDGPIPPYSTRILDILDAECVKATYFLVGRMAHAHPATVRRIAAAGHTIGTHSQNHPLSFHKMPLATAEREINDGIASVGAALGDPAGVAPFFRIPGLLRADQVETYLAGRAIMAWSADFPADDWRKIGAAEIVNRALARLEAKGKGILLLHDIQPATVLALPALLRELKQRGFRIVHVVPATTDHPATPTVAAQWFLKPPKTQAVTVAWPVPVRVTDEATAIHLPTPSARIFDIDAAVDAALAPDAAPAGGRKMARTSRWPKRTPPLSIIDLIAREELPVSHPESFGFSSTIDRFARADRHAMLTPAASVVDRFGVSSAAPEITSAIGLRLSRWPVPAASLPKSDVR